MNLFEAVKESVSPRQIADYYGLLVRNDMVSCLFHDERTPSMKLYDDHRKIASNIKQIQIIPHYPLTKRAKRDI